MNYQDYIILFILLGLAIIRPIILFGKKSNNGKSKIIRWISIIKQVCIDLFELFQKQPVEEKERGVNRKSIRLLLSSFYLIIALSLFEYFYFERNLNFPVIVIVIAIILITIFVKIQAKDELGPAWSPHVEFGERHQLVDTGPYSYMRHPSYLNGIIEGISIPIISSSLWTFCLAVPIIYFVYRKRINAEEIGMRSKFGKEYEYYERRVSSFEGILGEIFGGQYFKYIIGVIVTGCILILLMNLNIFYSWSFKDLWAAFLQLDLSLITNSTISGEGTDNIQLKLNQLLTDTASIIGVSVSILTAGLAIATPIYLNLWQQMTESLFTQAINTEKLLKNYKICDDDRKELRSLHTSLLKSIKKLNIKVKPARRKLRFTLIASAVLLLFTILIIALPLEEISYVIFTLILCLSLAIGIMFIHIVFELTQFSPIRLNYEIQYKIFEIEYPDYIKKIKGS